MPTASHTLSPSALFRKAWAIAYQAVHHFGGRARQYFPAALKEAWAETALAERRALQGRLNRLTRELADVKRTMAVARQPPASRPLRRHERLATSLASGTVTAEQVATLLRVDPWHVYEIAAGRVGLAPPSWRKVFSELEVDAP